MNIWKRLLGAMVMALCVMLIILSVAGIAGTWYLSRTMSDMVVRVLARAEHSLEATEEGLSQLDTRVSNARNRIIEFEGEVDRAAGDFVENPVVLTAVAEKLDLGIAPAVLAVLETVQGVREKVIAVQNAVQALNALPFVSLGENLGEEGRLQRLSDGASALNDGLQQARNGVRESKAAVAGKVMFRIGKGTARLDSGLETIQATVGAYRDRVSAMLAEVRTLRTRVPLWFDLAAIVVTVVLFWLVLSQVVMFVYGLSIFRNENLFGRWIPITSEQPTGNSGNARTSDLEAS